MLTRPFLGSRTIGVLTKVDLMQVIDAVYDTVHID
jgi:hypothetical protein